MFRTDTRVVAVNLDTEDAGLIIAGLRIVIDHHGHQLTIYDVDEGAASGNHCVLVPVVRLHQVPQRCAIADHAHQTLGAQTSAVDNLTAERHNPHWRVLGIELPGVDL